MKLDLKAILIGSVSTLCLLATGALGWALHSVGSPNDGVAGLTARQLPATALSGGIETSVATHRIRHDRDLTSETDAIPSSSLGTLRKEADHPRDLMGADEGLASGTAEKALLDHLRIAWTASEASWAAVVGAGPWV